MRYLLLAAALSSVAAPALAQDGDRAPFTGPHIEALTGYDRLESDGANADGLFYGVGLGYDFQVGKLVAGVEGEWSDSTTRVNDSNILAANDSAQFRTGRDLYVGGRIGIAAGPSTLLYAKAGYTNARIKGQYFDGASTTSYSAANLDGYRLGVGVEQKFNLFGPSGFVKAEYRYSNYRNADLGSTNVDIDADRHQAIVGVGVRF